jgi:hypothetical protein
MAATRRGKIGKAVPPKTSAAEAFAVELRAVSGFRLCGTNEQVDEIRFDVILNRPSVMWWSAFADNKWC